MKEIIIEAIRKYAVEIIATILTFVTVLVFKRHKAIFNHIESIGEYHQVPNLVSHVKLCLVLILGIIIFAIIFLIYSYFSLWYSVIISIILLLATFYLGTLYHTFFIALPAVISCFVALFNLLGFTSWYLWGKIIGGLFLLSIIVSYYQWIFQSYSRDLHSLNKAFSEATEDNCIAQERLAFYYFHGVCCGILLKRNREESYAWYCIAMIYGYECKPYEMRILENVLPKKKLLEIAENSKAYYANTQVKKIYFSIHTDIEIWNDHLKILKPNITEQEINKAFRKTISSYKIEKRAAYAQIGLVWIMVFNRLKSNKSDIDVDNVNRECLNEIIFILKDINAVITTEKEIRYLTRFLLDLFMVIKQSINNHNKPDIAVDDFDRAFINILIKGLKDNNAFLTEKEIDNSVRLFLEFLRVCKPE